MSGKIINFEEQWLKNKVETYKKDLQTNYVIGKRVKEHEAASHVEIKMDQYDLYHIQTHEPYMGLAIFPDLGLVNINSAHSEVRCALALEPNIPLTELETISFNEIEQMMTYIQFTETDLYANNLESASTLSFVKESPFYEEYLHVLAATQYCLASIVELHI